MTFHCIVIFYSLSRIEHDLYLVLVSCNSDRIIISCAFHSSTRSLHKKTHEESDLFFFSYNVLLLSDYEIYLIEPKIKYFRTQDFNSDLLDSISHHLTHTLESTPLYPCSPTLANNLLGLIIFRGTRICTSH